MATKNKMKLVRKPKCKAATSFSEARILVEGEVSSQKMRDRLKLWKSKNWNITGTWMEFDGKELRVMVQLTRKCEACGESYGLIAPLMLDIRKLRYVQCSKCSGLCDPHAGMKQDLFTGEWFIPKKGCQVFATVENRTKYNNRARMLGARAMREEAANNFAKGAEYGFFPVKEK